MSEIPMNQIIPLTRYGLKWNGPKNFIPTIMDDGYWTPWHIADELITMEAGFRAYWAHKWESEHKEVIRLKQILKENGIED